MSTPSISAIVLAAGSSRRMGKENKLLLPLQNKTVVETVVDHLLEVPDLEIIVVIGHEAELVRTRLGTRPIQTVVNPKHLEGMTTSIQCGVRAAHSDSLGYMICLADLPLIGTDVYQTIVQSFRQIIKTKPKTILVPRFQSKKGHPIVFAQYYSSHILQHRIMEGCKQIVQDHQQHNHFIQVKDAAILLDMDTPDEYQKLRNDKN